MTILDRQRVAGVDPSLTSCGVTVFGEGAKSVTLGRPGVTKLPLDSRLCEIGELSDGVLELLGKPWGTLVLVLIEAPDVSRSYGGLVERIDLICRITLGLVSRGIPVGWVPSPVIKGYATGKGGGLIGGVRAKQAVLGEAQLLWPSLGIANTDQADSAFLAAMAADAMGWGRVVPDAQAAKWLYHTSIQYPDVVKLGAP